MSACSGEFPCSYCWLTSTSRTTPAHGRHGVNQPFAPKVPCGAVILVAIQTFLHLCLGFIVHWRLREHGSQSLQVILRDVTAKLHSGRSEQDGTVLPLLGLVLSEELVEDAVVELSDHMLVVLWVVEVHVWLVDALSNIAGYFVQDVQVAVGLEETVAPGAHRE